MSVELVGDARIMETSGTEMGCKPDFSVEMEPDGILIKIDSF